MPWDKTSGTAHAVKLKRCDTIREVQWKAKMRVCDDPDLLLADNDRPGGKGGSAAKLAMLI